MLQSSFEWLEQACVRVVGAFHAVNDAAPLCEVKQDVVDDNYEGGAALLSCQKVILTYPCILYKQNSHTFLPAINLEQF